MWQAALGAGASLLGTALQNRAAKQQASNAMSFEREMSNTAYQRAMVDMKKAGLNPILAGKLGGASTPRGQQANIGNLGTAAMEGAASAIGLKQAKAEAEKAQTLAEIEKLNLKGFQKWGIAPWEAMYKPGNLAGSAALSAGVSAAKDIQNLVEKAVNRPGSKETYDKLDAELERVIGIRVRDLPGVKYFRPKESR